MKLFLALATAIAAVAAMPAQAAITLTGSVPTTVLRVGQSYTATYSISGLPGERILGGGAANGNYSANLGNGALRLADTAFDDASTNPAVFFFDFTAIAVGPAAINASLNGVDSTTGVLNIVAPTITFNVFAAVPEPASWAMMIGGFGLVGGTLRRRRTTATVRFA